MNNEKEILVESIKKPSLFLEAVRLMTENDKHSVIFAVLFIVIYSLYMLGVDAKEIASNAISGLFGIAVGRATK